MTRVLALFLDGYEESFAQKLMAAGEMPEMVRLAQTSARFVLDHGAGQRTGLAGEHVATGLSPDDARRWSAVHFDPRTYEVWQEGTRLTPFAAHLAAPTVVFDVPYFDLRAAPAVNGAVAWGAHDPGVTQFSRPADLISEVKRKFGSYPAQSWIYGFTWPSTEKCRSMGHDLAHAVDVRAQIARWLLADRFPDWKLALIAVSESHSVAEALWHGIDPQHRLHGIPSTAAAGAGLREVYHAIDRLVGNLASAFPDAITVVFAMGGMGDNRSDLQSMALLPELMYRNAFKHPFFKQPKQWAWSADGSAAFLSEADTWQKRMVQAFAPPAKPLLRTLVAGAVPDFIKSALRRTQTAQPATQSPARPTQGPPRTPRLPLNWMPASAYRYFWDAMPAFALPSYYDGRVRINLKSREASGKVELADYKSALFEIERIVRECTDPATGETVVDFVEYTAPPDPAELHETQADLVFVWKGAAAAFQHPVLGRIGPLPYRRTGGHTGASGVAYVRATGLSPGERGTRSAYDVVPTIMTALGEETKIPVSGSSLLSRAELVQSGLMPI
jgi:hypothetical protein